MDDELRGVRREDDLRALRRDDELLDVLGGRAPADPDVFAAVATDPALSLLAALRAEVAEGLPDAADPAGAAVEPVVLQPSRRRRLGRSLVAGAAAVTLLGGGSAAAAAAAGPGSPLWGLHQALLGGSSVRLDPQLSAVSHLLDQAEQALGEGHVQAANATLTVAERQLDDLSDTADAPAAADLRSRAERLHAGLHAALTGERPASPAPADGPMALGTPAPGPSDVSSSGSGETPVSSAGHGPDTLVTSVAPTAQPTPSGDKRSPGPDGDKAGPDTSPTPTPSGSASPTPTPSVSPSAAAPQSTGRDDPPSPSPSSSASSTPSANPRA